jgi:hypothetical protein
MSNHLKIEPAKFSRTGGGFLALKLIDARYDDLSYMTTGDIGCLDAPSHIAAGSVKRINDPHSKMLFTSVIREAYRG